MPIIPRTVIQVLVVCDGYRNQLFSFSSVPDKTDTYFTLTTFVNALRAYNQSGQYGFHFSLTLAHRDYDLGVAPPAPPNLLADTNVNAWFTWHGSPTVPVGNTEVDLSKFDVIYMFGFNTDQASSGANLCWDGGSNEDQLWAFVQFMEAGGGVFAAGDHEDRGAALCGSILRVRSMRRWWWDASDPNATFEGKGNEGPYGDKTYGISFANSKDISHPFNRVGYQDLGDLCSPPGVGPYRLDTIQPGPKGSETIQDYWTGTKETGVPFDRQSDDIPQPLTVITEHPILALDTVRYLSYLPDHMHEGLVIGNNDPYRMGMGNTAMTFEHNGTTIKEYPPAGGTPPLPMVIAQVNSLHHVTPDAEVQHEGALDKALKASYGAISVYDGSSVNVGRVVTESSFHHFLDINLIGDPATQVSGGTNRTGFTTTKGQPYLTDFHTYWANLTIWLAPRMLKPAIMLAALDTARRNSSIRMVSRPEMKNSGHAIHDLGQMVAQHLDSQLSAPMLQDVVHCSLEPEHHAAISAVLTDVCAPFRGP
jgi:hypothetical protein